MPNSTFYNNINFLSSSGVSFYPDGNSFISESGYKLEAFDDGNLFIYKKNSGSVSPEYLLNISSSNGEPRIGFGFDKGETFEKTFEIKSKKDSNIGTELILESSRITTPISVGDELGKISFIADSGSFINKYNSGSIAEFKSIVTSVGADGASGKLVIGISKDNTIAPLSIWDLGYNVGQSGGIIGSPGFTNLLTGSIQLRDFNSSIESSLVLINDNDDVTAILKNDNDNLIANFYITGSITSSNLLVEKNLSVDGNILGADIIGTDFVILPNPTTPQVNEVTWYSDETVFVVGIGNTLKETSSVDFTFYRRGEPGYEAASALQLTGSLLVNGNTVMNGSLTITGSQLITDDITSDGTIRARVKSFDIPHPTRKGKRLVYGALEGPEHGIYCRGESKELKVLLPPEWRAMVDKKGITVQITPIGEWQPLYFKKLHSNWLYFGCGDNRENVHFYWEIKGERTDVPSLETVQ